MSTKNNANEQRVSSRRGPDPRFVWGLIAVILLCVALFINHSKTALESKPSSDVSVEEVVSVPDAAATENDMTEQNGLVKLVVYSIKEMLGLTKKLEQSATPASQAETVSSYAPATALEYQVSKYMEEMEDDLADPAQYANNKDDITENAAGLTVFYLALGLNDQANTYKAKAPNLVKAAQKLAAATTYDEAKAAFDAIKAAEASTETLAWKKVAPLASLMKQVPNIDSKMKRTIPKRMYKKQDECLANCAAVAALMQGSIANADETEQPAETVKWTAFSIQGRDAAAAVAKAVAAQDAAAAEEAMAALRKSCDDCHAVFHQNQKTQ